MKRWSYCSFVVLLFFASCESEEVAAADTQALAGKLQGVPPPGSNLAVHEPALATSPAVAVRQSAPQTITSQATTSQPNNDCWWYQPGERSLVAVWVSPRLPGQVPGGFRFVNLFLHDGGDRPAVLLHSSPVHMTKRDEVGVKSDGRSVHVTPVTGKTWQQVVGRKDLHVELDRS
tara:strand:+ start:3357 stop:3881 length:525 start_codon:yes stop_codon:yes gene_type:complete